MREYISDLQYSGQQNSTHARCMYSTLHVQYRDVLSNDIASCGWPPLSSFWWQKERLNADDIPSIVSSMNALNLTEAVWDGLQVRTAIEAEHHLQRFDQLHLCSAALYERDILYCTTNPRFGLQSMRCSFRVATSDCRSLPCSAICTASASTLFLRHANSTLLMQMQL